MDKELSVIKVLQVLSVQVEQLVLLVDKVH